MIFTYDILVNFCEDELLDFFEWNTTDNTEFIKKTPVIKTDNTTIKNLKQHNIIINKDLLNKIHNQSVSLINKKEIIEPYILVFSSKEQALIVELNKNGKLINKSSLLLDQEKEVLELIKDKNTQSIKYKIIKQNPSKKLLTRKEQKVKKIISLELEKMIKENNINKLTYLYNEYFDKNTQSINVAYKKILESLKNINKRHFKLYELIKLSYITK